MSQNKAALKAQEIFARLCAAHPDAHCELDHASPFQLLVATVLSAQSTDVAVNRVTIELFHRFPDAPALAAAAPEEVEQLLNRIGMYRQKTKNIIGLSRLLLEHHGGEVPRSLKALITLPGVGRKTANVVLGVAFGAPEGVVVDTHVQRLSQRLGFSQNETPEKIELDLMRIFPQQDWDRLSHTLIFHGRRICAALKPACAGCPVNDACPSAFHAENVGRKAKSAGRRAAIAKALTSKQPGPKAAAKSQTAKAKTANDKTANDKAANDKTAMKQAAKSQRAKTKNQGATDKSKAVRGAKASAPLRTTRGRS